MATKRTKPEVLELRARIFELYAQRLTYQQIGDKLGIAESTVRYHINESFKAASKPIIEQELQIDLEILRQTLKVATEKYLASKDPQDYTPIDKILDKRAKLLGLYTPEKHQHTITEISAEDIALMELVNEQRAKADKALEQLNE